jgi:hypothetical protein
MMNGQKYRTILAVVFTIVLYFFFAYFIERENFYQLASQYLLLFIPFFYFLKFEPKNFSFLVGIAILFRLVFLFAIPNLSQDFYRFIWDGRMILEGFNPYISLPETFIQERSLPINQAVELYQGMGELNGSHFTNYPPINQLNFLIAALLSNSSILGAAIVFRLQIILADIGIIYFGKKILEILNLPIHYIFLYALNPFIIIEMTGNLHFEPVMLFFLVWSLYLLLKERWIWAAILLGISVSVKLIPLLFLPLFFQWFVSTPLNNQISAALNNRKFSSVGFGKLCVFGLMVILTNVILFLPFVSSELISSYTNSVGLWFRNFEFNASLYYIAREIGYTFRGYNEIAVIGKIMPSIAVLFLIIITFFRKNKTPQQLITVLLIGLTFYYFTTTTMHPWYLATLILLSVFTRYRFTMIWSIAMILSYQAYANDPWKENLWFVGIEYLLVFTAFFYEVFWKKKSIAK